MLSSIVIALTVFSSCSKTEEVIPGNNNTAISMYDKQSIIDAPLPTQLDYVNFHLTSLMEEVSSSSKDFGEMFAKEANKGGRFGKIMFEDIISNYNANGKGDEINEEITYSLEAFLGVSEEDLYPYIEKIKNGDSTNPTFLISTFDTSKQEEVVIGFKFNSVGQLEQLEGIISEEDIFGSNTSKGVGGDVYQLGISICGDVPIEECVPPQDDDDDEGNGGGNNGGSGSLENLILEKIKIKDKKESWINRNEVRICVAEAGGEVTPNWVYSHCSDGPQGTVNDACNTRGDWLAQYSNSEISNGRVVTVNKQLSFREFEAYVLYSLFEYDKWPAPAKIYQRQFPGNALMRVRYRSYQSPYHNFVFTTNNVNQYRLPFRREFDVNFSSIEYNVEIK